MSSPHRVGCLSTRLNESPSEKEGKYPRFCGRLVEACASMKALPKRKGNEDGLGFYFGKCTMPQ